jgi:hypothetical protein
MDYPLENLGPERFQQFCQALLARTHPNVQCFPVAQPDGGRDAVTYVFDDATPKFIVSQVKFVRKPAVDKDPRKWLLAIMDEEAPKVSQLIPRGASQYCLMTNIDGTAHLDAGSIDQLNKQISKHIKIPFTCWWRDDINRRLDNAWDLKWVYPDLMTGPDFLRAILESGISEDRERRESTVRAFLAQQLKSDEQVRFRQVELQRGLLDLFTDVPINMRDQRHDDPRAKSFATFTNSLIHAGLGETETPDLEIAPMDREQWLYRHDSSVGAATLLLQPRFQSLVPHCVIEGAPGQGKSTVSQYVCQVCRLTLLKEEGLLAKIPDKHKTSQSTRLPIRIDLRDLATWLGKEDPFDTGESKAPPPGWKKTLEAFLAYLISFQSGGLSFTTDDLIAVVRVSATMIVFDGLDEVADIKRRQEVVDEITRGVQRLEANAASLQTIVTSRPAAFANSPGMPPDKYPHFQLLSLTRPLINEYAGRWLRAKNIDARESLVFQRTLKEKLDQPHIRGLARNPMQLAILLNLILTRGTSLPDKRTALFDSYIDTFLNRESEKSATVRDHRELLIDIHRYLAWLLHSESERGNSRGSISQERLQQVLVAYLTHEGQDPRMAETLFSGMVERVVALVSRVQGTYEFEVQPLREYFAARFLYDNAPYSPPGNEQRGTKPDRFDALARNLYWTNVTRFFAGCFSKGELPGLVERLQELSCEEGFQFTTHPRTLAATLLSDWVFMQNPKSVQHVVELVLEKGGLRLLLASGFADSVGRAGSGAFTLPWKSGGAEVLKRCFDLLSTNPHADFADELIALANGNAPNVDVLVEEWSSRAANGGIKNPGAWLVHGVSMGVISRLSAAKFPAITSGLRIAEMPLNILYSAKRLDVLEASEQSFSAAVNGILNREILSTSLRKVESALDALAHAVDPNRYVIALMEAAPVPLAETLNRRGRPVQLRWNEEVSTSTEAFEDHKKCMALASVAEKLITKSSAEWATEIEPWDRLVESGRESFGERWAFSVLASVASGIRSSTERGVNHTDLLDDTKSLCKRARYARLKSDHRAWWLENLASADSPRKIEFVCLLALTWARPQVLLSILDELEGAIQSMDEPQWSRLIKGVTRATNLPYMHKPERGAKIEPRKVPQSVSSRTMSALLLRADGQSARALCEHFFSRATPDEPILLQQLLDYAADVVHIGTAEWKPDLQKVRQYYAAGGFSRALSFHRQRSASLLMPIPSAKAIVADPSNFPSALIAFAEESWRHNVAKKTEPVAAVAERQKWFGGPEKSVSAV